MVQEWDLPKCPLNTSDLIIKFLGLTILFIGGLSEGLDIYLNKNGLKKALIEPIN